LDAQQAAALSGFALLYVEQYCVEGRGLSDGRIRSSDVDDATYEEEATGRRSTGRDQIVQAVQAWKKAFSDLKATIKETVGSGDAIVVELEWEGTHDGPLVGPFGQIPATNKRGRVPAVEVVRFDGDRIREIRHYFDLLTILAQLGVAPPIGVGARPNH
jgi:steroid delta-isomerase-like uncharacterized protein